MSSHDLASLMPRALHEIISTIRFGVYWLCWMVIILLEFAVCVAFLWWMT